MLNGEALHRSAKSSASSRFKKKLTLKTTWFKGRGEKPATTTTPSTARPETAKCSGKTSPKGSADVRLEEPVAALFVPYTPWGTLAKKLREQEAVLKATMGFTVKVVQERGSTLQFLLHQTNPWAEMPCPREDCLTEAGT